MKEIVYSVSSFLSPEFIASLLGVNFYQESNQPLVVRRSLMGLCPAGYGPHTLAPHHSYNGIRAPVAAPRRGP